MEYKYKAFISYRHTSRDSAAAEAIHTAVEHYVIPKKLRKDGKKRPGKVFRDEEELGATHDLPLTICDALDQTEYLIVVCSPDSARSEWVRREIAHFLSKHPIEKVLTVVTGGKPEEIVPLVVPECPEALSIDLRSDNEAGMLRLLKERFLKLCAPLLGCDYDDLVRRDEKRRRGQILAWMGGIAAVAAVIIGILSWFNIRIEGKNQELAQKNEQLEQQNNEILLRESEILTQEAWTAMQEGDRFTAIEKSVAALDGHPFTTKAEQILIHSIQPFQSAEYNYIFDKTVLEQEAAILDYCIGSDGKQIFTADASGNVTCFDADSGELLWSRQLIGGQVFGQPQITLCDLWDSVIYYECTLISALSRETGQVLWTMSCSAYMDELFLLGDDQREFFLIRSDLDDSWSCDDYILERFSCENGSLLESIPIARGGNILAEGSELPIIGFPDTDDGRYDFGLVHEGDFIGSYCTSLDDGEYTLVYYLIERGSAQAEPLLVQSTATRVRQIYHMSVEDDGDSLLCIRRHAERYDALTLEKISLRDRTLIWQADIPGEGYAFLTCRVFPNCIILGADDKLFLLDPNTGAVKLSYEFPALIAAMEILDNGFVTYLLQDGTYSVGWFSAAGFQNTSHFNNRISDLGSCVSGQLYDGGSPRLQIRDGSVTGFTMLDEQSGGGYAVLLPNEDSLRLTVHRPIQVVPDIPQRLLSLPFTGDLQVCAEDLLVVCNLMDFEAGSEGSFYYLVDPSTLEVLGTYPQDTSMGPGDFLFFSDGSGYINRNYGSPYCFYPKTGEKVQLSESFSDIAFYGPGGRVQTRAFASGSCRLVSDNSILTATATEQGLKLWRDGSHLRDVPYPTDLPQPENLYNMEVSPGAGGFILLKYQAGPEECVIASYDLSGNVWHTFRSRMSEDTLPLTICGGAAPVFLLADPDGTLRLHDIVSGELLAETDTAIPHNSIQKVLLCRNDTLAAVITRDNYLRLYELSTGELLFHDTTTWNAPFDILCFENRERGELYFSTGYGYDQGFCLAGEELYVRFVASGMLLYNEYTDSVICARTAPYSITATRVPDTESLLALGKKLLGN